MIGPSQGRRKWAALLAVAVSAAQPAWAQPQGPDMRAREVLGSQAFLASHPDMRFRYLGQEAVAEGRLEEARNFFEAGAGFADKLSQAALAEMWWNGRGGVRDRALGYAWMDLAAERGTSFLLVQREQYWAALDPAERARAVTEGQALYARFGDPVAQPRLERELRQGLRSVTGSRTGSVNQMEMVVRDKRGARSVDQDVFYRDDYWQPSHYWKWQAQQLELAGLGLALHPAKTGTRD